MTQLNFECQQICITYFIICHILSKWNALHRKIGHSSSWHTDPIYLLSAVLLILRRNKRILNLQIQPESEAFCLSPYQSQTCASVGSPSQIVLVIIGVFGLIPGTHIVLETKWPQGKILSGPGQEPTGLGPHTDFMAVPERCRTKGISLAASFLFILHFKKMNQNIQTYWCWETTHDLNDRGNPKMLSAICSV